MAITYPNKVSNSGATEQGIFTPENANEIKAQVNALEDQVSALGAQTTALGVQTATLGAQTTALETEVSALEAQVQPLVTIFTTPRVMLESTALLNSSAIWSVGAKLRAGGFDYIIAPAGASDHHLVTLGGVKLYVDVTGLEVLPFDAFAPAKNGYAAGSMTPAPDMATIVDDIPKLNLALQLMRGREVRLSPGTYGLNTTLVIPGNTVLSGGIFGATIAAKDGFVGWMCESENYATTYANAQTDANGDYTALVPKWPCIRGVVFDGAHQSYNRSFIRRPEATAGGGGIRFHALQFELNVAIFNVPGVGLDTYARGGNGPTPLRVGRTKRTSVNLLIDQTAAEGWRHRGPADIVVESLLQCNAGARLVGQAVGQEDAGKKASLLYGATNGGYTDGVVFDGVGAEVLFAHSWGNRAGRGIVQYGGRFLGTLIVAENNHFGGISLEGGTGIIGVLKAHKNGGWVVDHIGAPGVYHESANVYHNAGLGGETNSHIIGQLLFEDNNALGTLRGGIVHGLRLGPNSRHLIVSAAHISKRGVIPGHGVMIDAGGAYFNLTGIRVHDAIGDTGGGVMSAAVYRAGAGTGLIQAQVVNCSTAYHNAGQPTNEDVSIIATLNEGQTLRAGNPHGGQPSQRWNIGGRINDVAVSEVGGVYGPPGPEGPEGPQGPGVVLPAAAAYSEDPADLAAILVALGVMRTAPRAPDVTYAHVGSAAAAAATLTLPAHQTGDIIIGFMLRATNTPPVVPAGVGWTTLAAAGGNTTSYAIFWKRAASNAETFGTGTATACMAIVYRPSVFIENPIASFGRRTTGAGNSFVHLGQPDWADYQGENAGPVVVVSHRVAQGDAQLAIPDTLLGQNINFSTSTAALMRTAAAVNGFPAYAQGGFTNSAAGQSLAIALNGFLPPTGFDAQVVDTAGLLAALDAVPLNLNRDYVIRLASGDYGHVSRPNYSRGSTSVVLDGDPTNMPRIASADFQGSSRVTLRHLWFRGTVVDAFGFPQGSSNAARGIVGDDSNFMRILGCLIENYAFCVQMNAVSDAEIGWNTIRSFGVDGLRLYGKTGSPVRGAHVHHNVISANAPEPIWPQLDTRGLHYALDRACGIDPRRSDQLGYGSGDGSYVQPVSGSPIWVSQNTKLGRHPDCIQGAMSWQNVVIEDNILETNNVYCHGIFTQTGPSSGVIIRRNRITSAHVNAICVDGWDNTCLIEQCLIRAWPGRNWALGMPDGRADSPAHMQPVISTRKNTVPMNVNNTVTPAFVNSFETPAGSIVGSGNVSSDSAVPTGWASTDVANNNVGHTMAP